jgi:hypothetical protein
MIIFVCLSSSNLSQKRHFFANFFLRKKLRNHNRSYVHTYVGVAPSFVETYICDIILYKPIQENMEREWFSE